MAQIQFSLTKKINVGRPEHSLTTYPSLRPITSHFCLTLATHSRPAPPPQSGRDMCILLKYRKILVTSSNQYPVSFTLNNRAE